MSSPVPATAVPIPTETPVVRGPDLETLRLQLKNPDAPRDLKQYLITAPWADYLSQQSASSANSPQRVANTALISQSATIGLTTLPTSGSAGVYRFSYLASIDIPAGVASSLTIGVTFTQNGVTKTFAGAAITGNTNNTVQSNTWILSVDANTPVQYEAVYVSNPAAAMRFGLVIILESVNLLG